MTPPFTWQDYLKDALVKSLPELALEACELPRESDCRQVIVTVDGSELQGTVAVICSKTFLERTCPIADNDPEVLQDWTSELANLIMGRFKNSLLAQGVTIKIHPPKAFEGKTAGDLTFAFQDHGHGIGVIAGLQGSPVLGGGKNIAELMPGDAVYRLNEPAHSKKTYDVIAKIRSGISSDEFNDDLEDDAVELDEDQSPSSGKVRRELEAISWDRTGMVHLLFSGNLSCTFSPAVLLQEGCTSIALENYQIEVERVGSDICISIPELRISLSQPERAVA